MTTETKEKDVPLTAEQKKALPPLTKKEEAVFVRFKLFPKLDKGSQDRLRKEIDSLRKTSPSFKEAFESGLGRLVMPSDKPTVISKIKDAVAHPIDSAKEKVGTALLEHRNKAPEILVHPHATLSAIAEPWNFEKDDQKELVEIVRKLGAALRGVNYGDRLGMAAPQIGISKRVFVCQGAVCINPTFTPPKVEIKELTDEGCYSVPQKLYRTRRSKYGWATWYSVEGEKREYKLSGLNAIVFQHELDHLDGKCCCDIGEEIKKPETKEVVAA